MGNKEIDIYVEICREEIELPQYARLFDAGMDIKAACDVTVSPNETTLVPTGLKMAIPEGYELQVRPRSGLSLKTALRLPNSPGTIDAGYRDEIHVIVSNTSCDAPYSISKGDRIAQFVLCEVPRIKFIITDSVAEIGTNRGGGLGSSGI